MRKKYRIIRIKEAVKIAKKNMWKEGLPAELIDSMLNIPHIEKMVYAYYVNGDSYVFRRDNGYVYWCVSRDYLLEKYPKVLEKIEGGDIHEKRKN